MGAERRIVDGCSEVFIDNQLVSRVWSRPDLPAYLAIDKIDQYEKASVKIHLISMHQPQLLCWDGGDYYDASQYEAFARWILNYQKDAHLILYVGCRTSAPYKWTKKYPEECTLLSNGVRFDGPSIASGIWRNDSSEAVRRIVQHFDSSDICDRIIGYNFVMGANEWFAYSAYHKDPVREGFADYSEPMQQHFREWVRNKYENDEKALRESWKDTSITFDTVRVPSVDQRMAFGHDNLFFVSSSMGHRIPDWCLCWHDAWASMAELWCRTAKETSVKPILCGMMNGYSYCGATVGHPPNSNYGGARRLFSSPWVDFVQSPYHYLNRSFPGVHYSQHAADSVLLRGKLLLDQLDTKTHLKKGSNTNAHTPFETEQILKRDISNSLSKNCHCYWMEIHQGVFGGFSAPVEMEPLHFDDPEIKQLIGNLQKVSNSAQGCKTVPVSEVAFFCSKESVYHMKSSSGIFQTFFSDGLRQFIMPYIGTPFDDYIFEDFNDLKRDYKVYIFSNTTYIHSATRAAIRRKIENGATAVFFYAPGFIDEKGPSTANIRALCGLECAFEEFRHWLHVDLISPAPGSLLDNVTERDYGTDTEPDKLNANQEWFRFPGDRIDDYRFNPQFHCVDKEAETLGILRSTGKPGLVVKKVGKGTIIYSAAPLLPASILRNALVKAGVHLYSPDGDLVYANSAFVSIISMKKGIRMLHLPSRTDIFDAMSGEKLAGSADRFEFAAEYGETRIFRTGK